MAFLRGWQLWLPCTPPSSSLSPRLFFNYQEDLISDASCQEVANIVESSPHLAYITKQIRDIEVKCVNPVIIMVIMRQFNDLANCLFSEPGLENIPYPVHPSNSA